MLGHVTHNYHLRKPESGGFIEKMSSEQDFEEEPEFD